MGTIQSDGTAEDLIRAFVQVACAENHAKTLLEKFNAELENGLIDIESREVVVALLSIVEVSKIKINPWTKLGRGIGRAINGEIIEKVAGIENEVKEIRDEMGVDRAVTARVRILRFNDEVLNKKRHSKDNFDQCLSDIDNYEKYCREHPDFRNNMTVMATENIKACYKKCLEQHDFL